MIIIVSLLLKTGIDLFVAGIAAANRDWPGALLFLSFALVDLASLGVLK